MLDIEQHILQRLQPWLHCRALCIAFSGGMDSTVLLHALARLAQQQPLPALRAIHIQHGLQAAALAWPAHCERVCKQLNIPITVVSVQVASTASVEQAARDARYRAFTEQLQDDELLLLAQHLDDQAETVLFRLLRGAGVSGLRGIPEQRDLAQGRLLRPLLGISQHDLQRYAQLHQLQWIDDPTNASDEFARNYLRRQIISPLQARWPAWRTTLQRTSEHMQEAQQLLDELAQLDLERAQQALTESWLQLPCLDLAVIRSLTLARQKNLLRYWLSAFTLPPDSVHWRSWQTLRDAKIDASPVWRLQQGALLRSQEQLYWLPECYLEPLPALQMTLTAPGRYELPGNGCLIVTGALPEPLVIGYRQGAQRLWIEGRGHRDLKRLMQEQAVPAFLRARLPLVFIQGQLCGLANLPHLNHARLGKVSIQWQFA